MRDQGFFGHRSPRTGDLADRLAAARYRAALSGENLALSPSVHEAHRGLLASLGHRRNLLSPASREDAVVALKAGHDVLVFPGGDLDACRPFYQPRGVHFGPRRGYIRIALQAGVPVVPVATIGSHYTMLMAPGGAWLARILGLKKLLRTERVPLPLHLWPPPVRITSEALPAMDVIAAAAGMEDEAARVERAHELVYGAIRDAVANMRPD
jgi:1-acyl-sn-glycerol-3-phosphate acyltransferase